MHCLRTFSVELFSAFLSYEARNRMHLETEFMMSLFAAFMTTSLVNVTGSLLSSERCFLNSSSSASSGRSPNSRR